MAPWTKDFAELLARLDAGNELLERLADHSEQQHSPQLREWEVFREATGGATASGSATMTFRTVPLGWEYEVRRITVSVGGASSGATIVVYVNGTDEMAMVDFVVGMSGSSPSRAVADEVQPILMVGGDVLTIVVSSAASGTNAAAARIEGKRREQ